MAALLTAVAKVLLYHLPCAFEAGSVCGYSPEWRDTYSGSGQDRCREIHIFLQMQPDHPRFPVWFLPPGSFGSSAGCDNGRSVVDGFYHLALYAGPVPQGNDYDAAEGIQLKPALLHLQSPL